MSPLSAGNEKDACSVYFPREDSFLLCDVLKKHVDEIKGKVVMDVGTGSGIIASELAKHAKLVVAGDINKDAIRYARKEFVSQKLKNVLPVICDLASCVKNVDVLVFNPPYLPEDENGIHDVALDGGKHGCEVIMRFLRQFSNSDAKAAFLIFSSLSSPARIIREMRKLGIKFENVGHKRIFFEELYVYLLKKQGSGER